MGDDWRYLCPPRTGLCLDASHKDLAALLAATQAERDAADEVARGFAGDGPIAAVKRIIAQRDDARARLGETKDALRRIAENAESWHGTRPEQSGHVRALAVISQWARAALLGDDEQAEEGRIPEPPEAASEGVKA